MTKLTETERKFSDRLRNVNDIDGDPDITVVTELSAEWDALEAKRVEAIQVGLALVVERDALREQLREVAKVVFRIPWGLGMVFDSTNLAVSLQARVDAAVAQLSEARAEVERQKAMLLRSARMVGEASAERILVDETVDALQAEVERLRLPAEAWLSLPDDVQIDAKVSAAARAAKGEK